MSIKVHGHRSKNRICYDILLKMQKSEIQIQITITINAIYPAIIILFIAKTFRCILFLIADS